MTRKELINFNISQRWTRARIKFLKEQIETIGKLNSVLSDMPKGSRKVEDNEAESLVKLLDQIQELKTEIENNAIDMENKIKEELNKLEPKYGLLLYHHYILGDSIKYIAKEILHYREKYVYDLKKEALEKFDELQEKKGRIGN
jgi:DNA anti-recombination protein RmuC